MGANKPSMLENAWDLLMVTAWLGLVHVAVAVFAVSVWCLPHPAACAVLGAYVVAGVWPNAPPYPRWGMRIARAVTEGATRYFPCTIEWEDERAYHAAAEKGTHEAAGKGVLRMTFDNSGMTVMTSRTAAYYIGFVPS